MSIWRFAQWLAPVATEYRLSLGEGATPLVRSRSIGPRAGLSQLYFKVESANPSGSYKDRFAAVAISAMCAEGKSRCVATSSGNTGAALAAYCAAAAMPCEIAIVESAPLGKLQQMLAYGARLKRVRGFGIDQQITHATFERLAELGRSPEAALQISAFHYSPLGMTGVQTISYELVEQLAETGQLLRHVFAPAGGGGLALAVARGLLDVNCEAAVHVVQPEGNDTIATPLRNGEAQAHAVTCTSSVSGLQVPSVIDGNETIAECRASGGTGHTVSDIEVWKLQSQLAREEGIFCEPAGAVALAGAMKAVESGEVSKQETIVCLVTGTGFKDVASVERMTNDLVCPTVEVSEM